MHLVTRRDLQRHQRELRAIFAAQVKARAERARLSQNFLADFSGVSRSFMSKILRRLHAPTIDVLAGIAQALECEPADLLKPRPEERPTAKK